MTKAKERLIEAVQIAALNLLDGKLTPWERQRADEIYDLANQLEDGEPGEDDSDG